MVGLQMLKFEREVTFTELIRLSHEKKPKKVKPVEADWHLEITLNLRENIELYIKDIERCTKRKMTTKQINHLTDYVNNNRIFRADKNSEKRLKCEYQRKKCALRKEWEKQTGETWPKYEEDIYDKKGRIIRTKGQFYDAHHIIELSYQGVNKWWNIFPAKHPDEHQQGIHNKDSVASKIFLEITDLKIVEQSVEPAVKENEKELSGKRKRKVRLKK